MLYLSPLPPSCCRVGFGAFCGVRGFLVFLASSARSACASSFCFCSAVCLRSIFGLAAVAIRSVKPTRLRRAAYFLSLACSKTALFKPMVYSPAFSFSSGYPLVFCRVPGFAFGRCASFKSFWPPALVQQAPPAIIFQAVCRLRGALLFRGLRPSSIWGFPFWLLGLTGQSSRPAFGGRLTFVC